MSTPKTPKPEPDKPYRPSFDLLSCFKVAPHYSYEYTRILYHSPPDRSNSLPQTNRSHGAFSKHSRSRLTSAINWMLLFSPRKHVYSKKEKKSFTFKLNFLTLTLSDVQVHSDQFIHKHMLRPLLKWMARRYNAWNYVWKAETQDNGNIHFHVTTNKFIHYIELRNKWNTLQLHYGYLDKYNSSHGDLDAPSTEIKAVKNTAELARYLGKYFSKNDTAAKQAAPHQWVKHFYDDEIHQYSCNLKSGKTELIKRRVHCKLWSCNEALQNIQCYISERDPDYYEARADWIERNAIEKIDVDFGKLYFQKVTDETEGHPLIINHIASFIKKFNLKDDGITRYEVDSLSSNLYITKCPTGQPPF